MASISALVDESSKKLTLILKKRGMKMNRIKNYLFTIILTLTFGLAGVGSAAAQTDVKIVNTDREPVPTVAKGITLIENVDEPARQPFQREKLFTVPEGANNYSFLFFNVPVGKRAVIEQVTARAICPIGQFLSDLAIYTNVGGLYGYYVDHFLVPSIPISSEQASYIFYSQQMRLYADPNTPVMLHMNRNQASGITYIKLSISGYFVDVP